MTISEEIKLQAKLLEWEAPKGLGANLKSYETDGYMWVTNGIVVARISLSCYIFARIAFSVILKSSICSFLIDISFLIDVS